MKGGLILSLFIWTRILIKLITFYYLPFLVGVGGSCLPEITYYQTEYYKTEATKNSLCVRHLWYEI